MSGAAVSFSNHSRGTEGLSEAAYYTVSQAAVLLQVSPSTVRRWIASGRLAASRLGRRAVSIRREDLAAMVDAPDASRLLKRQAAAAIVGIGLMGGEDLEAVLQALREREAIFRQLLRSFPRGWVSVFDQNLRCILAEGKGLEQIGLSGEQLLGKSVQEIFSAEVADYAERSYRQVLAGEAVEFELPLADRVYSLGAAPLRDTAGNISAVMVVAQDITRRKRQEEVRAQLLLREQAARAEAEAAQQRLTLLAEASRHLYDSLDYGPTLGSVANLAVGPLADWCVVDLLDDEGLIRQVAVAHVKSEKVGLVHELRHRYPPDLSRPYGVAQVLRTGRSALYPEIRDDWRVAAARDAEHLRLMRELGACSSMTVPLVCRGRILGAMSFVSAESGRRYGAADLALAEDLAGRCAVAVDNARLYGQLQQTIQTREAFLASLVHDLKNPLTTSLGYSQMVQRQAAKLGAVQGADRILQSAAKIESTTRKVSMLLDELLDIARIEAGQPLRLVRGPTDLVALARQVAAEHQRNTERHRIRVDAQVAELVGQWDAARLERVLDNLLGNAVKYSPDGGEIRLCVALEGTEAVLDVSDDGLGIPASDLHRVFERFQRGKNVERQVAGTGLGLHGVRQIVQQHGGQIVLESQEGLGTTVKVRLPLD